LLYTLQRAVRKSHKIDGIEDIVTAFQDDKSMQLTNAILIGNWQGISDFLAEIPQEEIKKGFRFDDGVARKLWNRFEVEIFQIRLFEKGALRVLCFSPLALSSRHDFGSTKLLLTFGIVEETLPRTPSIRWILFQFPNHWCGNWLATYCILQIAGLKCRWTELRGAPSDGGQVGDIPSELQSKARHERRKRFAVLR
jgi:hypothetical protein